MFKTQQITKVELFPVSLELLLLSSRIILGYFQEEFKATFLKRWFRAHTKSTVIPAPDNRGGGGGGEGGSKKWKKKEQNVDGWDWERLARIVPNERKA